ncbi:hypothetical protein JCGZ_11703 [Jatropha curcas]|uniref:Glycosyltransferase n=2 Tax=Jatropha curcas TaxID=180498 RepID=A0A067K5D3_JATCU|nr:hypothetical protein JCGZ_11703 [Jatropha curcas]
MAGKPHVLVIPYPAQGHVMPLMKLAYKIAENGYKVTFVNTDVIQAKIMSAMHENFKEQTHINFVSIPDGLESNNDKKDPFKDLKILCQVMPSHLQNLIEKINQSEDEEQITCVIAETTAWWALEVAQKLGIRRAAFSPPGLGNMALVLHIPKLIEAGVIDANGMPITNELISLSRDIPAWNPKELLWSCPGQPELQKFMFENFCSKAIQAIKISNWHITNSFYELEQSANHLVPSILPIGPLTSTTHLSHFPGSFRPEDSTCLSWLDKQPEGSVIYISFGSTTVITQKQFEELASGLEQLIQPFLWIVRSDLINGSFAEFPNGFKERVANRGKIVEWASQEKILSHPSIACFLSHCGWNSVMEGISNGIPFLCWPYFADQFYNQRYTCETWKVGLRLNPDEKGIITRQEIETKIKLLISDNVIKETAAKMKEIARKSITAGGSSLRNFKVFIEQLKCYKFSSKCN